MSDAYIGEIRNFAFGYAPQGWLPCDGRLLQINQNAALYSLLGTFFGGNGTTTFALPDMRGRVGISQGQYVGPSGGVIIYSVGQTGGSETVALTTATTPQHAHSLNASKANGTKAGGAGNFFAQPVISSTTPTAENLYGAGTQTTMVPLNPAAVSTAGGNSGHQNMQPFQAVNFAICTNGYYPPRN